MKVNAPEKAEIIELFLSKDKTPIAYQKKVEELIRSGLSEEEAENFVSTTPFEMEFYYSDNLGLFLVECEAVDNAILVDPYSGEPLEYFD
tara:strand:+ start:2174 stop:2443 length:270 start_codon:yes stop_codon:yes gene_type:complete